MLARFAVFAFLVAIACGRPVDPDLVSASQLELNGDGQVTCADLDHLLSCMHHPHDAVCASSDLNHDGAVDAHDAQIAHHSLAAHGTTCSDPAVHLDAGTMHQQGHDAGTTTCAHCGGHDGG